MSKYAETILLSEEIGRQLKNTLKDVQVEHIVKTEEKRPTRPHIINHSIPTADKWYEIKIPSKGVKTWSLGLRENYDINYCFEPSHSTYITLKKGATLSEDTSPEGTHAIYVKCATAAVTIELELWMEI